MGKFNLNELLSNKSKSNTAEETGEINKTETFKVDMISVYDLIPSKDNFYSVENIAELKDSIEMFGVQQNLTVKQLDDGKYLLIVGHRRRLAALQLVEEGKTEFELLPCCVKTELDYIREQLLLITTNATARQLTDWEKSQQVEKLRELLEEYRKNEKLPGRTREIIADILNTSQTQVARFDSISRKLTPEFKEEFKKENINVSTAYEISKLPKEEQQEIYQDYSENGTSLSINGVKEKKVELKEEDGEGNKHVEIVAPEPIVIERIPDEVVQDLMELEELREKVRKNEESDKAFIKFSLQFKSLADNFKEIIDTLQDISDSETKDKCRGSINTLTSKMLEKI